MAAAFVLARRFRSCGGGPGSAPHADAAAVTSDRARTLASASTTIVDTGVICGDAGAGGATAGIVSSGGPRASESSGADAARLDPQA